MNLDNMLLSADTVNVQAGGKSFFDRVSEGFLPSVAGATVSGLASLYNTGAWYANKVFDAGAEEIDTAKVLADVDVNWAKYYKENQGVLDTVGFIGGSFIPGGLAVKALKGVQKTGQAAGFMGKTLGFTAHRQQAALEAGLKDIASSGPSVFSMLNKNKLAAMSWGVADNVLQSAVYEVATLATMHQGSTLKDESAGDILWDVTKGAVFGGAFGGAIDSLFVNGIFKQAGRAVDKKLRQYDSVKAYESMGLNYGDEAFGTVNSILELPKEVLDATTKFTFNYNFGGKARELPFDITALATSKLRDTAIAAEQNAQIKLAPLTNSDSSVSTPFIGSLLRAVKEGRGANKSDDEIRQTLGNTLFGLAKVKALGDTEVDLTKDIVYLSPKGKITSVEELTSAFSTTKSADDQIGYKFIGNPATMQGGVIGPKYGTIKDAYAAGWDFVIDTKSGVHINPNSKILKKATAAELEKLSLVYHTRTGSTHDTAIATLADSLPKGGILPGHIKSTGINVPGHEFKFSVDSFTDTLDPLEITARHLWASQKLKLADTTVAHNDFSLLDSLATVNAGNEIKVKLADGTEQLFNKQSTASFKDFILEQKLQEAQKLLDQKVDARVIAYKLNVEQDWLEKAIASDWNPAKLVSDKSFFRDLESYMSREHLVLTYNKPSIENTFPDAVVAFNKRVDDAKQRLDEATAAVVGEDFNLFPTAPRAQTADSIGTGATFFGASNANYDEPLKAMFQYVGTLTDKLQKRFREKALNRIQASAAQIIGTKNIELGAVLTAVRRSDTQLALDIENSRIIDLAAYKKLAQGKEAEIAVEIPLKSKETLNFLQDFTEGHREWFEKKQTLAGARGTPLRWDPQALYLPPINTRRIPYFAFVREQDGKMFSTGEVSMVTAKSAQELQHKLDQIRSDFPTLQVITKDDSRRYHKALGDYDYQSGLNAPEIDSFLRKKGMLGDFAPTLEPAAVVEDFVNYIARREDSLARAAVSTKYGQHFAELQFLSDQYTKTAKSKFGYQGKFFNQTVDDPFGDYTRLALNISKRAEYTLWHEANAFVDALGTRAYEAAERAWVDAKGGSKSWQEANAALKSVGLDGPFTSQESYLVAQSGADRNFIKQAIYKGNMLLATIGLRLDFANSLVNIISTPMMLGAEVSSIRNSLKKNPELLSMIDDMMSVAVPGQPGVKVPATMRLMTRATANFFGPGKEQLMARYKDIGAVKDILSQYHVMLDELALTPKLIPTEWAKKVEKWTEKGATWTFNNFAEDFTRFVSADAMRQITDPLVQAGKMGVKEQNAFISIFVNRVQGNYIASQRPIVFQGTLGAALSLFQTYQFNLLQQLFRHIENKDARTLAYMAGMQTMTFGLNGLPMFDAINTHLVGNANINEQHHDAYSSVVRLAGKEWGDWLMYGTASALPIFSDKSPSLYTRGDLNPRHVTVLPNPMNPEQIPVVAGTVRVVSNLLATGKQIVGGADIGQSLLFGLEHNGVSRPLAGMAQVLAGQSTTSRGSIIAANQDWMSIASASRILGAKPVDESIAFNHLHRLKAYQAHDRDRIETLGSVIKQRLRDGTFDEDAALEFMGRYAAVGGRTEGYTKAIQRWFKEATQSDVNRLMNAHKSAYGQRLLEVMGADPLPDYATPEE
ncbi:MAG: hypothetical protein E6R04_04350 [Spirochaetes bacterium]|nr:MAG: hypothetical protein E6R04_04350 [Spirochaetota bacterium]